MSRTEDAAWERPADRCLASRGQHSDILQGQPSSRPAAVTAERQEIHPRPATFNCSKLGGWTSSTGGWCSKTELLDWWTDGASFGLSCWTMDWWTSKTVDWWTNPSVDWWTSGKVDWWTSGLVDWWTSGTVDWWTSRSVDWLSSGTVDWWPYGPTDWLTVGGLLVDKPIQQTWRHINKLIHWINKQIVDKWTFLTLNQWPHWRLCPFSSIYLHQYLTTDDDTDRPTTLSKSLGTLQLTSKPLGTVRNVSTPPAPRPAGGDPS